MKPYFEDSFTSIYQGHALKVLKTFASESIQMCLCSPPYWGLRNYSGGSEIVWGGNGNCEHEWNITSRYWDNRHASVIASGEVDALGSKKDKRGHIEDNFCLKCGAWRGQLGLEPTPELYVEHLILIFREVKRVLRKDGSFYLNIGDTYASGTRKSNKPQTIAHGNEQDLPLEYSPSRDMKNYQSKCMVCIPERVMFAMIEDDWILHNKIIWHKPNAMPSSVKDRFTTSWEYLYFFGKNSKTILWRNQQTGEWRDTRPTKEENYPWGGRYQHIET
ncbi:unnamed protein product, partial [marine sediment metagenome]